MFNKQQRTFANKRLDRKVGLSVMFNKLRESFNQREEENKYKNMLHLSVKDYLNVELLHKDNGQFILDEIKRLQNLPLQEGSVRQTVDKNNRFAEPVTTLSLNKKFLPIEKLMKEVGLKKVDQIFQEGVGVLPTDTNLIGFGNNKSAIICEVQDNNLKHIWITGKLDSNSMRERLGSALVKLGVYHDFIAVNWHKLKYYYLYSPDDVSEFMRSSC